MEYEKDFVQGIGREEISLTKEELQKFLVDETARNWITAKYGVFMRGILASLVKRKQFPKELDQATLVNDFILEKFSKVIEHYSKTKGSFRAYLRVAFINYVIDVIRKKPDEKVWSLTDGDLPEKELDREEQIIYEAYDQKFFKPLFKKLDQQLEPYAEVALLFEYYQQLEQSNSALFEKDDFKEPVELAIKIDAGEDLVSKYIWSQCSFESRELFERCVEALEEESKIPLKTLVRVLSKELNGLLKNDEFYLADRFAPIKLTPEIKKLQEGHLQGKALTRLNRLLLEQVYSKEIEKIRKKDSELVQVKMTKYQRRKARQLLEKNALTLIQESSSLKQLSSESFQEVLEYFLKLYLREKFSLA